MKHLFILLALVCSYTLKAQTKVKYQGDVLIPTKPAKKADTRLAQVFIDKDSVKHTVYVNSNGRYYIIRKSKKTGKEYKQYLDIQP